MLDVLSATRMHKGETPILDIQTDSAFFDDASLVNVYVEIMNKACGVLERYALNATSGWNSTDLEVISPTLLRVYVQQEATERMEYGIYSVRVSYEWTDANFASNKRFTKLSSSLLNVVHDCVDTQLDGNIDIIFDNKLG